jgi:hypothetical protein
MADEASTTPLSVLLGVAGLTVGGEEARQVSLLHDRFAADRALLRRIVLGETEPAVTFTPDLEMGTP